MKILAYLTHHPVLGNFLAVIGAGAYAAAEVLAQPAPSYFKLLVDAGMVGVLLVFLLRVLPGLLEHSRKIHNDARDAIREHSERHLEAQQKLVESFERQSKHWRDVVERRGYCPIRDGKVRHEDEDI